MRIRDGLSWCLCGDRLVFLDLRRDCYFALAGEEDRAFRGWQSAADDGSDASLARLKRSGVLIDGQANKSPAQIVVPACDLADQSGPARWPDVARAGAGQFRARLSLRCRSL